jgi:hypothetical protein
MEKKSVYWTLIAVLPNIIMKRNWLGSTLSGPKRPLFRLRRDHANQLL